MSTTVTFNDMLKRYTPWQLHLETLKRHNWFVNWVPKKTDWYGGTMEIPFEAGQAASFSWGSLTADTDIAEDKLLMGTLTKSDLKELWSTMKFNNSDLRRHGGDMKRSYLQIMPQRLNRMTELMSQMVSITYFGDGSIDKAIADGTAGGKIKVSYPHRFNIGQKVVVDDDDTTAVNGYIVAIDVNTKELHIQDARSGGANVNLSAFTVLQNAKIYNPGVADVPQSLKSILLPSSAGGSTNYFGYQKSLYPALQSLAVSGSGFTTATLLDDLFSAYYEIMDQGKGSMDKILVIPLKWMQYIAAGLENNKRYTAETKKVGYGLRHVSITGPDGSAEFVAIRDCDVNTAFALDKQAIHLCGNSFFKRDKDANGNEFFVKRETSGLVNIVDTCFEAALVVMPSHHGIIYDVPTF